MEIFIDDFFIRDYITVKSFLENLDLIKNPWRKHTDESGTKSMKLIEFIPPAFFKYFIAAYPDVYLWVQKEWDSGQIVAVEKMKKLSDDESQIFLEPEGKLQFYREIINQYKSQIGELECRK